MTPPELDSLQRVEAGLQGRAPKPPRPLPLPARPHPSLEGLGGTLKRALDIVLSAGLLALLALPIALLALLIRLDSPGRAFFRQRRVGFRGVPFMLLKFRTMEVGAEDRLDDLGHLNERGGPVFKARRDPRVTRVGRWLRRSSLDELPQLWNVLMGEMSLVGPRPPLPREVVDADPRVYRRLEVMPGLTGLWQVSGRSLIDFDGMLEIDQRYIAEWSFGLDLRILLRTLPAVLSGRGAY